MGLYSFCKYMEEENDGTLKQVTETFGREEDLHVEVK